MTKAPEALAVWDPLGKQTEPKMTAHDVICCHTMAGTFEGVNAMFHAGGYDGTESHFGMAGSGKTHQWQDLDYQADANLDGNWHVISIETADKGENFPSWTNVVPPWTTAQVKRLIKLIAWLCKKYDIPPKLLENTRPGQRGIGYHRQGIDGNFNLPTYKYPGRADGGEKWSESFGKICPGDARISQLINEVIPDVQKELKPKIVDRWQLQAVWEAQGGSRVTAQLTDIGTLLDVGNRLIIDDGLRQKIRNHRDAEHRIVMAPRKVPKEEP